MNNDSDSSSTQPYLIRALYEWCTDNGFTPYLSVSVDDSVQVPHEYVKDGEIVLNISFDATSSLKLGNEFIEFKGRFAGTARDISVPVGRVTAIYARENGQGMAFALASSKSEENNRAVSSNLASVHAVPSIKLAQFERPESEKCSEESTDKPEPPRSGTLGSRPVLKRVK